MAGADGHRELRSCRPASTVRPPPKPSGRAPKPEASRAPCAGETLDPRPTERGLIPWPVTLLDGAPIHLGEHRAVVAAGDPRGPAKRHPVRPRSQSDPSSLIAHRGDSSWYGTYPVPSVRPPLLHMGQQVSQVWTRVAVTPRATLAGAPRPRLPHRGGSGPTTSISVSVPLLLGHRTSVHGGPRSRPRLGSGSVRGTDCDDTRRGEPRSCKLRTLSGRVRCGTGGPYPLGGMSYHP